MTVAGRLTLAFFPKRHFDIADILASVPEAPPAPGDKQMNNFFCRMLVSQDCPQGHY
jgi:hypothetical protein